MKSPVMLPENTVRGRIQQFLKTEGKVLRGPVIEVGSRWPHGDAAWADNRRLFGLEWMGVDFIEGPGVDTVAPAQNLPFADSMFGGAVHSEVLEHLVDPWAGMRELHRVLIPGAAVLVTTLTSFPIHGYPDDYWRFTPNGLKALMEQCGFKTRLVRNEGEVPIFLNNTGKEEVLRHLPIHVFGVFFK